GSHRSRTRSPRRRRRGELRWALDHELSRRASEVPGAGLGDDEHVLESHAPELGQIDAGLHGHDVAGQERRRARAPDGRQLVDLETYAVPGAMDEAARRTAIGRSLLARPERVVPGLPDDVLDELVHLAPRDPRAPRVDAGVLRAPRDLVELRDLRGRLAFRDGARD